MFCFIGTCSALKCGPRLIFPCQTSGVLNGTCILQEHVLLCRDGRAFLWDFAFRVPAFLEFSFAFRVPALLYDIVFAFLRALTFLFRVPMLLQFTQKWCAVAS